MTIKISSKGQGWPLTFQPRPLILESHQFIKTLFSQKPLGQLNLNFIWRLHSLGLGNQSLFNWALSHDQDGCHAHIL